MSGNVLITGSAARIGRHIAQGLADDGWTVIVHYNRSETPAENLVAEINRSGGKAFALGANLAVPSELNHLVSEARDNLNSPINALINNASTFDDDSGRDFTRAEYDHHMNVNLYAALKLSKDFAAQLPGNQKGSIINFLDQRVLKPDPSYFTYRISKAALFAAIQTMAQTFAPNIRVNAIGPGPTLRNKAQSEAMFAAEQNSTLLGNGSPPDSIIQAVRYLLAAESVTGQMIAVDGGQHLAGGEL